jgi:outer membrane biosynthesis protein TonB
MAFEVFLEQGGRRAGSRRWRWITCVVSTSLHLGALLAVAVHSFWGVEEISPRGLGVTFLSVGTPPVPPSPPAARKTMPPQTRPAPSPVARVRPEQVVQPRELLDLPTGQSGSLDGEAERLSGNEAPVTNAIAGTLTPAERVVDLTPVMLGPGAGVGQRLSDLSDPRFRPTLPPALNRPGTTVRGLFRICVSVGGQVNEVKVLRSADPLVDGEWTTVIRRWQYRPFTLNGRPTAFCHPLLLEVQSLHG